MPLFHTLSLRRCATVVLAGAVVVPLLVPTVALADDDPPAGRTVVGELVQAWPEQQDHEEAVAAAADGPLSWIETPSGNAVRVSTEDLADALPGTGVPVGATVEVVVGREAQDDPGTDQGLDPALEVLSAAVVTAAPADQPPLAAAATDQVTVVMMIPAGGAPESGRTLAQIETAINGPVAAFWSGQSGDTIRVTTAAGNDPNWVQAAADCSDPYGLWNEAAAHANWTPGTGKHLLVYLPRNSAGCAYGLAQVGSSVTGGGKLYVTDVATSVIAHELGHNFGLGHSSGLQCDSTVESGTCQVEAYRDYYDVMGASWDQVGSLNAPQADRLGLLPAAQQRTVSATDAGSYTLNPLSGATGTRALKLVVPGGGVYWLEYRAPTGQDAWLAGSANRFGLESGVLLRRGAPPTVTTPSDTSLLLDATPSAASGWNGDTRVSLPLNSPVVAAGGALRITVRSVSPTEARVWIGTASGVAARGTRPVGSFDAVSATGASVSVAGWALDPDTPADPLTLHVYIDHRGVAIEGGIADRSDVGRVYPAAGNRQGYSYTAAVAPGVHEVCVFAIDSTGQGNTLLACRTVTAVPQRPVGSLDVASGVGTSVTVRGWAFDPDTPTDTVPVHVYIDGRGTAITADGLRGDVGSAFPGVGNQHGFEFVTPATTGPHEVCVFAIDTAALGNTLLRCRTVTVVARLPIGSLDIVSVSGSTLSVAGWTFDPDVPVTPTPVQIVVDGTVAQVTADSSRPDVGTVIPAAGSLHGFTFTSALSQGAHLVCAYAIDTAGAGSTLLGCRSVTA